MAARRIIVTGATGKAGRWILRPHIAADDTFSNLPSRELVRRIPTNVTDSRSELVDTAAQISNRPAKHVLGWKQDHLR